MKKKNTTNDGSTERRENTTRFNTQQYLSSTVIDEKSGKTTGKRIEQSSKLIYYQMRTLCGHQYMDALSYLGPFEMKIKYLERILK